MFAVPSATRANLPSRYAFSFVSAPEPNTPIASGAVLALGSRGIASATRSSAVVPARRATARRAVADERRGQPVAGGGAASSAVHPLMQSWPLLTGKCGSPCDAVGRRRRSSPISMPHWKAQYGQCVRDRRASVGAAAAGRAAQLTPRHRDEHGAVVAPRPGTSRSAHTPGWSHSPVSAVEPEGVQRADHLLAGEHPVGERAALVRAAPSTANTLPVRVRNTAIALPADAERPAEADRQVVQRRRRRERGSRCAVRRLMAHVSACRTRSCESTARERCSRQHRQRRSRFTSSNWPANAGLSRSSHGSTYAADRLLHLGVELRRRCRASRSTMISRSLLDARPAGRSRRSAPATWRCRGSRSGTGR